MKFGQLVDVKREIFFFKFNAESETRRLVPDFFLLFKKALHKVKESVLQLVSLYFDSPQISIQ